MKLPARAHRWLLLASWICVTSTPLACSSSSSLDDEAGAAPAPDSTESASQPTTPPPGAASADAAAPPPARACAPLDPRATPLEVSVLPEAGATPFVSVLERATQSIRVMVYQMGPGPIIDTLEAKARAGIKVSIILDVAQTSTNEKYMKRLQAAGAEVVWSDPQFRFMHAKLIVVDGREAVISTGNYASFRMGTERNFVVRDADAADVDVLVKLFDADFARQSPVLDCTRLLVSPVNAKERLVDFIASAKSEIVVESMQLADTDVRDALAERKAAGVDVRVLLADPSWIDANQSAATFLAERAIPARHMKEPGVHVKAIVIDGKVAFTGSINLSFTSLNKNREVGLLVTEPANVTAMHQTFEKDWTTATPF